jgi:hypothetical protein
MNELENSGPITPMQVARPPQAARTSSWERKGVAPWVPRVALAQRVAGSSLMSSTLQLYVGAAPVLPWRGRTHGATTAAVRP